MTRTRSCGSGSLPTLVLSPIKTEPAHTARSFLLQRLRRLRRRGTSTPAGFSLLIDVTAVHCSQIGRFFESVAGSRDLGAKPPTQE
jgi:hypothetical protein